MNDSEKIPLFTERVRREFYERRVLVLDGPLDDDNGTLLAAQLITLAAEDPLADIALWIHSPGGSVPAMLAIHDVIRTIPNDVATLAFGMACSAGQFLLSAGTRGKRRALPHARILMHQGSAGIAGTAVDIELQADDLRHTRDTVLGLIAEDTGQTVDRVSRTRFMTTGTPPPKHSTTVSSTRSRRALTSSGRGSAPLPASAARTAGRLPGPPIWRQSDEQLHDSQRDCPASAR